MKYQNEINVQLGEFRAFIKHLYLFHTKTGKRYEAEYSGFTILDKVRHRCQICDKSVLFTKDHLQNHLKSHKTMKFNDYVKNCLVVADGEDEKLEYKEEELIHNQIDEEEELINYLIDEEEELIYYLTDEGEELIHYEEERNVPVIKKYSKDFKFPLPNTTITPVKVGTHYDFFSPDFLYYLKL